MSIPKLSPEELEAARKAATKARRERAELKEKVRTGKLSLVKALDKAKGDDTLSQLKVVDLLKAVPRVGERRAAAVMEGLSIAPNRRVRGLGRLQLAGLKAEFGDR
ncbi:MAG: 30S ribosomal protein S13 [Propionibacteriaceae bacterium]|nr:30S ribosomal protein S13 [Propionibacteriaceae bacterium]